MLQGNRVLSTVVGCLLAALALPVMAANIYKYVDRNGQTVFNSFIPAEYVKNGYTILNEQGQVVQIVARAATAEELNAQQAAKAAEDEALAARIAREEADKLLIRLYREPADIIRKRDNSIEQLATQQGIVMLSLTKADADIAGIQSGIDNAIKQGAQPSENNVKRLESKKEERAALQAQIDKMEADKTKVAVDAAADFKRLRELMGLPVEEPPPVVVEVEASTEQAPAQ